MEELISQYQEQIAIYESQINTIYGIGGSITSALVIALGILWKKLNDTEKLSAKKDQFLKQEYKENMTLFFELKGLLESITKGVESNIPEKMKDLKEGIVDKLENIKCKA